jgi:hypothetical protein
MTTRKLKRLILPFLVARSLSAYAQAFYAAPSKAEQI